MIVITYFTFSIIIYIQLKVVIYFYLVRSILGSQKIVWRFYYDTSKTEKRVLNLTRVHKDRAAGDRSIIILTCDPRTPLPTASVHTRNARFPSEPEVFHPSRCELRFMYMHSHTSSTPILWMECFSILPMP